MVGEFANGNDEELFGTGAQLSAHIDELIAASDGNNPTLDDFSVTMGKLLSDRIDHGVVPMGYVMATQLLAYDCGSTGVNGFTGERMPREVTDLPPVMYSLFNVKSIQFARGAFGEEFADQVEQVYEATRQG